MAAVAGNRVFAWVVLPDRSRWGVCGECAGHGVGEPPQLEFTPGARVFTALPGGGKVTFLDKKCRREVLEFVAILLVGDAAAREQERVAPEYLQL